MARDYNRARRAFVWIVRILREHKIPFQITGGLAANVYGSSHPLADIDIEIPDNKVFELLGSVENYAIYGPERYKSKEFDLLLMTLEYRGQEIDICGSDSQRLFDRKAGKWAKQKIQLSRAERKKVFCMIVPVIPLKDLVRYKRIIARDVDIKDCLDMVGH